MKNDQLPFLKVTFKNVQQGDCVFIEWDEKSIPKIGIVDCNKEGVINFNQNILSPLNKYSEIEFIILSHPHFDHYSGLLDIINYCLAHDIKIKNIYHTLSFSPSYINKILNSFSDSNEDKSLLSDLIKNLFF